MDTENIKEFIKMAKSQAPNEEFRSLVDDFEALAEISMEAKGAENSPEYKERLSSAQRKFWAALENILPSFGITPEQLEAYFVPSGSFSEEEQRVEALQQYQNRGA